MVKSSEKILADINATLDQLIENADVFKCVSVNPLFASEIEALQKTQESLLARLVHMQDLLQNEKVQKEQYQKQGSFEGIEKKVVRLGKLNAQMISHFSQGMKRVQRSRQPQIGKRRKRGRPL